MARIPPTAWIILWLLLPLIGKAQSSIKGFVMDEETGEPLIGANVLISGTNLGVVTDLDGAFILRTDRPLPLDLAISYTGYEAKTVTVTSTANAVKVRLSPTSILIEAVEVKGSRILERLKESPLTIESLDLTAIRQSASNDFYEGLGSLKGVDLTTASMGFTIINTRGFNSTSPVRSLQIIDGVDNQSPGLNFSLGNFLGAPELDVLKVELIQGASSAFYGPNAFNGVIDIQTKDPFIHQGLSISLKAGERDLLKGEFRYAKGFRNAAGRDVFAFKINGAYMRAYDWEATNLNPTDQSPTDQSNPGGYDAVNVYGDESVSGQDFAAPWLARLYPGLGIFHRRGYAEADLVNYNTENIKGNAGLYLKLPNEIQVMGGVNFGSGTTVYQGENRFRLDDIFFWQGKVEVSKKDKFFLRAYITEEDAGKTFDIYATALQLQNSAKSIDDWNVDYTQFWQTLNTPKVKKLEDFPSPWNYAQYLSVLGMNSDSLFSWHANAQAYANDKSPNKPNLPFFEPGTARFDSTLNFLIGKYANDPDTPGTRFYDRSGLVHVHGEYKIPGEFADFTVGANFRQYSPDSRGTIFSDTAGTRIYNREFGVYGGLSKKLIPARLKLNATLRMDKNQNFDYVFSPAASVIYTPSQRHTLRVSLSSAIRNPTLTDQYLNLNVGRAQLLGNISGYTDLITVESFVDYLNTLDRDTLVYFNESPIRPEKVKTIEVGYRGTLGDKLWLDAGYYYSFYADFIGYKIAITSEFESFTNFPRNPRVYRISTNAASTVTTQGFSAGGNYFLGDYFTLTGNYSWNVLNKKGTDDPIIPAFNTPEHKFNIGISARGLPVNLFGARTNDFGFSVNYKWIEGFVFEGSPQFTGAIPTYDLVDAQVNWFVQKLGLTIKAGATNLLDKRQYQTYGGPAIGRLAFISFLYETKT